VLRESHGKGEAGMTVPTPHGCFFRENFARPSIARDFLHHHLPQALLAELDLERLRILPDTFVTEALREVYYDLVYEIPYRGTQRSVYLLFEHKSQSDHWVLLQLLHDISARSSTEIKGTVLSRLVQLALRHIYSDQPAERLHELVALIAKVSHDPTALDILESLPATMFKAPGDSMRPRSVASSNKPSPESP